MKLVLKIVFLGILLWMIGMTMYVQLHKPISTSPEEFSWQKSPWAAATLFDAYFGFLTFFVWVAYKEPGLVRKGVWFVLIMGLGNIAMSGYVLLQLFRLAPEEPAWALLMRKESR